MAYPIVRPLLRGQVYKDHIDAPNPHDQYLLEADALQLFTLSAYGGLRYVGSAYAFPDIGIGWQELDFIATQTIATPRGITVDAINSRLAVENPGVYALMTALSFGHNSGNNGRVTSVRLYNYTDDVPMSSGFQIGTGRNSEVTAFSLSVLFDVGPESINDAFGLQIGGGDAYTSVEFYSADYSINSVGEYRGALPSDPREPPAAPQTLMTPSGDTLTDPNGNILITG